MHLHSVWLFAHANDWNRGGEIKATSAESRKPEGPKENSDKQRKVKKNNYKKHSTDTHKKAEVDQVSWTLVQYERGCVSSVLSVWSCSP